MMIWYLFFRTYVDGGLQNQWLELTFDPLSLLLFLVNLTWYNEKSFFQEFKTFKIYNPSLQDSAKDLKDSYKTDWPPGARRWPGSHSPRASHPRTRGHEDSQAEGEEEDSQSEREEETEISSKTDIAAQCHVLVVQMDPANWCIAILPLHSIDFSSIASSTDERLQSTAEKQVFIENFPVSLVLLGG